MTLNTGDEILTDCGASFLRLGIVWFKNPKPTFNLSTKIVKGSGLGSFNSKIKDLTINSKLIVIKYGI
jgi:hypothetical protein